MRNLLLCCACLGLAALAARPALALGTGPIQGASPSTTTAQAQAVSGSAAAVEELAPVTIIGHLEAEREQIAPSLGAVKYSIGQGQIRTMDQGENSSFQQVLLHAPGVVQDEFGEIHVRGDHGDVQYTVNGVMLPEMLNGFAQEIDTHIVDSVALITGTLPAQYGERTAGVVNIRTKTGDQLGENEASVYGGAYGTLHTFASMGGSTDAWDYYVSADQLHDDLGIDSPAPTTEPLHDGTDQEKLFAYASHALDPTSRLTLLVSGSEADFEIPDQAGLTPAFSLAGGPAADSSAVNDNQNEQNYYAVLAYQKSAGALSSQISYFSRYTDIVFTPDVAQDLLFNGSAGAIGNSDLANGVQADTSWRLDSGHTLRAGLLATYDTEQLDNRTAVFGADTPFMTAATVQTSTVPEVITADSGSRGLTAGVYAQDEWKLLDSLTLNYGLRYDLFDVSFDDEDQLSPRANLVWQIDDATTAHAGYARYFMPPTLQYIPPSTVEAFENTTDAPNSALDGAPKVERDNYYDVGLSRRVTRPWKATADAFCKQAANILDDGQFGSAVILNNYNYATGTVYGAELGSTYRQGPLSLYGNFSYVQTWVKDIDSVQNEIPDDELAYIAGHDIQMDHQSRTSGSVGVSYELGGDTQLYTDYLYSNGLRAGFANLEQLSPYWSDNIGVEHTWRLRSAFFSRLKLRFDCVNLFNTVGEIRNGSGIGIAAAAYQPMRSFYGGITTVF